ncbi:hypothetical protein BC941DRAFT_445449 [Chlamydoabsidia padenii]|nr:hypothetical protein BC941DRAFT_445449 [Chlamydoabsidia padenii]
MKSFAVLFVLSLTTVMIKAAPAGSANPIVVHYIGEKQPDKYSFGHCFPFKNDGAAIEAVELSSAATCAWYQDDECEGLPSATTWTLTAGKHSAAAFASNPSFTGSYICQHST